MSLLCWMRREASFAATGNPSTEASAAASSAVCASAAAASGRLNALRTARVSSVESHVSPRCLDRLAADRARLLGARVVESPEEAGRQRPPRGVGGDLAERPRRVLGERVRRHGLAADGRAAPVRRCSAITHARIGFVVAPAWRPRAIPSLMAAIVVSALAASTGVKMTMSASTSSADSAVSTAWRYSAGPAEATMSTGLPTLATAGRNAEKRARVPAENSVTVSPAASHASTARMPGPPALVTIATRRPRGSGCDDEARGDVEHLVDRVRADHARLAEQRVDGDVARGERRRVAAGRARAGARPPALDDDDRLRRGRCGARAARSAAGCRTTRGRAG